MTLDPLADCDRARRDELAPGAFVTFRSGALVLHSTHARCTDSPVFRHEKFMPMSIQSAQSCKTMDSGGEETQESSSKLRAVAPSTKASGLFLGVVILHNTSIQTYLRAYTRTTTYKCTCMHIWVHTCIHAYRHTGVQVNMHVCTDA